MSICLWHPRGTSVPLQGQADPWQAQSLLANAAVTAATAAELLPRWVLLCGCRGAEALL